MDETSSTTIIPTITLTLARSLTKNEVCVLRAVDGKTEAVFGPLRADEWQDEVTGEPDATHWDIGCWPHGWRRASADGDVSWFDAQEWTVLATKRRPGGPLPDVERAALTLLWRFLGYAPHPVLEAWVNHLMEDHEYAVFLDKFAAAYDGWETLVTAGWPAPPPERFGDLGLSGLLLCSRAHPTDYARVSWRSDEAVYRLASAVQRFRLDGRPIGDVSYTIQGLGAPLATITTSLAAAVVEFAQAQEGIWASELDAVETRARELRQRGRLTDDDLAFLLGQEEETDE